MIGLTEKEQLLSDLVVIRRAEPTSPHRVELGNVRVNLERLVGPTVSRAMASRGLGISQTAFDRWLESGDIPYVISPEGRREIPLHSLLDLMEAVAQRRAGHPEDPHPLASVLRERSIEAESLDAEELLPKHYRRGLDSSGHRRAELRSLAYHRAVANRLDHLLVEDARRRLHTWRLDGKIDPHYGDRWEAVLSRPLSKVRSFISRDTQEARDLRQSSPFAGVLTEQERQRILRIAT